jgi:predicted methyltransferase
MRLIILVFTILLQTASTLAVSNSGLNGEVIKQAIEDPSRLQKHRNRDIDRLPLDLLTLASIAPGQNVAELAAGSGYYVALLSRIVGDEGKVYAVDPVRIFEHFPNARQTYQTFTKDDPLANVVYSVQNFDEITLPEPLDRILMVLYYHDTIWTGEDRAKMNKAIYQALKPGGQFLIVDHHALPGAGFEVTKELHRMDASIVIPEVKAAGFRLIEDSKILSRSDDPRDNSVFDKSMRGKTDRFVYLFQKPESSR